MASGSGLTEMGYTGRRHDSETGLMYFRNRYYSVDRGSFVTRDPLGYVDGASMYLGYFGSDGVDPSGFADLLFIDRDRKGQKGGMHHKIKWDQSAKTTISKIINMYKEILPLWIDIFEDLGKSLGGCGCSKYVEDILDLAAKLKVMNEKLNSNDKINFRLATTPKSESGRYATVAATLAFVYDPITSYYYNLPTQSMEPGAEMNIYIGVYGQDYNFMNRESVLIPTLLHEISHLSGFSNLIDEKSDFIDRIFDTKNYLKSTDVINDMMSQPSNVLKNRAKKEGFEKCLEQHKIKSKESPYYQFPNSVQEKIDIIGLKTIEREKKI